MSRNKRRLPNYCGQLPSGKFRVQVKDPVTGKLLSANKIDPREPKSFDTVEEVWAAVARVNALLAQRLDRNETVAGFLDEWTDPEHHRWGKDRSAQSMATYRSGMRKFVEMYGDRLIASITPRDIDAFLAAKPAASNVTTVGMFFRDAVRARKRPDDPTADFDLSRPERIEEDAPEPELLAYMLGYCLQSERIPNSLHDWLYVGSRTGMRTGELDAMAIDKLDLRNPAGPLYLIDRQYHAKLRDYTVPKHNSVRTILLAPEIIDTIERAVFRARQTGSRWLFNHASSHWKPDARKHYWDKLGEHSIRLRLATPEYPNGVSMKAATRIYFATQAVMSRPDRIPQIAHHYGHKDAGVTLLKHYTKLNDRRGQAGMADVYEALPTVAPVISLDARRRKA